MVLPLVLLALLFVLGTAALLLDAALLLRRTGERQVEAVLGKAMATGSVGLRAAQWDSAVVVALATGAGLELGRRNSGRRLREVDSVVRLGPALFLLTSSVAVGAPGPVHVQRKVVQLVRIDSAGDAIPIPGGWSLSGH